MSGHEIDTLKENELSALEEREMQLQALFHKYDLDGDGRLEKNEIAKFTHELGYKLTGAFGHH